MSTTRNDFKGCHDQRAKLLFGKVRFLCSRQSCLGCKSNTFFECVGFFSAVFSLTDDVQFFPPCILFCIVKIQRPALPRCSICCFFFWIFVAFHVANLSFQWALEPAATTIKPMYHPDFFVLRNLCIHAHLMKRMRNKTKTKFSQTAACTKKLSCCTKSKELVMAAQPAAGTSFVSTAVSTGCKAPSK